MGFTEVHDYEAGKAAWLAAGLPAEGLVGDDRRAKAKLLSAVPRLGPQATATDLAAALEGWDVAAVVDAKGCLVGAVRAEAAASGLEVEVGQVMDTAPPTVRPSIPISDLALSMAEGGQTKVFVTTPDGHLLGLVRLEDLRRG